MLPLSTIKEKKNLFDEIKHRLGEISGAGSKVNTLSIHADELDLTSFLETTRRHPLFYFLSRSGEEEYLAAGKMKEFVSSRLDPASLRELRAFLLELPPEVKVFGGTTFASAHRPDPGWQNFEAIQFILPRFLIERRGEKSHLYIYFSAGESRYDLQEEIRLFLSPRPRPLAAPLVNLSHRRDRPDREKWLEEMPTVIRSLGKSPGEKVVLARRSSFEAQSPLNANHFFALLRKFAGPSYQWFYRFSEKTAFISLSPERLFRLSPNSIESEAIAGTRRRGQDPTEDLKLVSELLSSKKEREEHRLVVDYIHRRMNKWRETLSVRFSSTPSVLKLNRVQHLFTPIKASLSKPMDPIQALFDLHPTPAVAGVPLEKALDTLRGFEDFDRGWYAGPVGWLSQKEAELIVAIRSCLIEDRFLYLFSGAGIVAESNPASEWQEIEEKIKIFLAAIETCQSQMTHG